jgi:hypothetical protein
MEESVIGRMMVGASLLLGFLGGCTAGVESDNDDDCYAGPGSGSSGSGASDSSSGSGAVVPDSARACVEAGGTVLPGGTCLKTCTSDLDVPGNDLFEDCLPLGMTCRYEEDATCYPPNNCLEDSECSNGFICVRAVDAQLGNCRFPCSTTSDCPRLNDCITNCPNGEYVDLGFCARREYNSPPTFCDL